MTGLAPRYIAAAAALTLTLICVSVAAAASYVPGFYEAGTPRGLNTLNYYAGVKIRDGSFNVRRISVIANCDDGSKEEWHFVKGSSAQIKGKIRSTGRFAGKFEQAEGYFKVRGRVEGRRARMVVNFVWGRTSTAPSDNCRSEHTFRLKRS